MAVGEQRWGRLHHALHTQRHARAGRSLHLAFAARLFDAGAAASACAHVVSIQIARSQLMCIGAQQGKQCIQAGLQAPGLLKCQPGLLGTDPGAASQAWAAVLHGTEADGQTSVIL